MTYQSILHAGMQILVKDDNGVKKGEADAFPSYVMADISMERQKNSSSKTT